VVKVRKLFKLCLILCIFIPLILGFHKSSANSTHQLDKAANYIPGEYVISSGGVLGASSTNYRHDATLGESFVGGLQGSNYLMPVGFWKSGENQRPVAIEYPLTENVPMEFKLYQNFPNPFNPETSIEFELPSQCLVMIEIYNTAGQQIRLLNSKIQGPGFVQIIWDGRDNNAKAVGSGVYLYRATVLPLEGKNILFQQTKKMLLVK
jgi:hypothetical protein